ncbi:peroxin Pex32 [Schizosaccharomyces octosporus yFS286]|uniref:Peroxin Pex32 n=1 Tax=Schizosaccharomyces octosporus (strain yFS286) TaxID=483514 RepID=S9R9Y9_SCHOY|nr:peroxin Pex32 [Schizosaccharomyces octosporus yFS286]EPX70954.1 peroxin Pex32 [Schizosaccharomyces octosporus yFS286]
MSTVKAHLLSEKNSSQSTVRSTGSELLDDVLRVLLWIAPWYTCLSTLFFAWLTVLYPRPTLACSISAWLFWFTSMRNINHSQGTSFSQEYEKEAKNVSNEDTSESEHPTTDPEEQTVHIDSDMDDETYGQGAPGYQLLHGKRGHGRTPSMDLHSSSDPSSHHKPKKKTQRSDSIGEESHEEKASVTEDGLQKAGRLSISKIVTDHLIRKDDYPVETSQKINQGPIFVKSSNGPTLLDAYFEPVQNLYRYSQMSNTLFFSYLPLVTAIFIFFLPTQALFIFLSSVVLAWHSPPMKAVSLAVARISVFSSLSEKFVFGKIENEKEEEEGQLEEPPSIPGDASERESKDGATTSLLKVFKNGTAPVKQEGTPNEVNSNENVTEKSLHLVEHQRYWVGVGWLNRTLPTDHPNFTSSDRNIPVAEPTAQFLPPDGIAWIDDKWSIGPWTYTDTFWRQPSLTQYKTAFTRFREWKRRYRTLPEEAVPVPSVLDTLSSEKRLDDEQVANSGGTNHTTGTSKSQSKAAANLKTIMNENASDTKPRSSSISTTR